MFRCNFGRGALLALAGILSPLLAGPLPVGVIEGPSARTCVTIVIDGVQSSPICSSVDSKGAFGFSGLESQLNLSSAAGGLLGTINSLSFGGNVDPSLGYALGVTDVGAPSTFSFIFTMPVVPAQYSSAFQTYSVSLTDTIANDGASLTPEAPNTTIQRAFAGVGSANTNLGVDVGSACTDAAGGSASAACGPQELSANFLPTLFNIMEVRVAFQGSGGGDLFSLNGRADLLSSTDTSDVPETSSFLMVGLGLSGVAAAMKRLKS